MQVRRQEDTIIHAALAEAAMDLFEIDPLGLDPTDRLFLNTIIDSFSGGPVGIETLAAAMGEDVKTLEDLYEPFLMQAGMLQRTPRGRVISAKAFSHLYPGKKLPATLAQQSLALE